MNPFNQSHPVRRHDPDDLAHDRAQAGSGVAEPFEPALTLPELAAELHVRPQALYDLRSHGRGPTGFRVGRQLRFRRSEITAWLQRLEAEDLERHATGARPPRGRR